MGIIELIVIVIVAFTTNNIAVSNTTTNNVTDTVTKEIHIQPTPSQVDLLMGNVLLAKEIEKIIKERDACYNRDI